MTQTLTIRRTERGLEYSTGQRYTHSEVTAFRLLGCGGATDEQKSPHDAGNEIIKLSELIKAERAVMAMEST